MIRYALKCADGHRFESWFQSAGAFDGLAQAGHLSCVVCGSAAISKDIMAPRVQSASAGADVPVTPPRPLSAPASPAEQALAALRKHVETHSTYVGDSFAAKARAMHLGDEPEAPIHGEARPEEARALIEDGVPVAPLPFRTDTKTN